MFCPNCGANLPDEAKFCPYCSQKLLDDPPPQPQSAASAQPSAQPRPRRSALHITLLVAALVVVLALGVSGGLFIASHIAAEPESVITSPESEPEKVPSTAPATTSPEPEPEEVPSTAPTNYTPYVGRWCSESLHPSQSIYDVGGTELVIYSVKGNTISFDLTSCSSGGRAAMLRNVSGDVENGVLSFTFSDDGWGNAGSGQLRFEADCVQVETTILSRGAQAMWELSANGALKQLENEVTNLEEMVGGRLLDYSYLFGNLPTPQSQDSDRDLYTYSFEGVTITAWAPGDLSDAQIDEIEVDYSILPDKALYRFCDRLSGLSTINAVENVLGTPSSGEYLNDGGEISSYCTDETLGNYIEIYFDANGQVISISCFGQS